MTNTMYLNHYGIPNRSFVEISTRVVPQNATSSWTREPVSMETAPQSYPAEHAWRTGERADHIAAAIFSLTLFGSAFAGAVFL